MKALVECLIGWLQEERSNVKAWSILDTLARETLKVANSADASQREFDVLEIAQACQPDREWVHDAAKRWFTGAKPATFLEGRRADLEVYFAKHGHSQALSLAQRESSGHHRAPWYFSKYDIVSADNDEACVAKATPPDLASTGTGVVVPDITYEVTKPGDIELSWIGRVLLGSGVFVTRSGRGLVWGTLLLASIALILCCVYLFYTMVHLNRPLQTNDLVVMLSLLATGWICWRFLIRPWVWLLEDRILLAGDLFSSFKEDPVQLDMAKDEDHRYVRLVRYSATCPICAGNIELRYGYGANCRRVFGRCSEVPNEHVFTFDRVTRIGRRHNE